MTFVEIYSLLALVMLSCIVSALESHWDQSTRDYILDIHNDIRRKEGGCRMNKLIYNDDLEKQAKQWAEGCVLEHELIKGRGGNLAWTLSHKDEKELIKGSTQRWFDEKNHYRFDQQNCGTGSACHYTQMVWANTANIGCYTTRCPDLQNAHKDAWYLVCFYTPKGNLNGEKPYDTTCDTPCRPGQTEEDGLCTGTGQDGTDTDNNDAEEICEDEDESCERQAKNGQCDANPDYMKKSCKKACKVCTPAPDKDCVDLHTSCPQLAQRGNCHKSWSYMQENCQKSCSVCG